MKTDDFRAEDILKSLFVQMTDTHLKPEFSLEGIMAALTESMDLAAQIVDSVHGAAEGENVACGVGCSYCCYSRIKLTPAEALLVFSWVDTEFSDQDRSRLQKRIRNNQLLTRGKSLRDRVLVKDHTPCIFLENRACTIYPVRPFICRAWTSYSHRDCRDAFRSGNHNAEIESSASSNYVFQIARETIQQVCSYQGLESEPLALPEAMDICLASEDPFRRWLLGTGLF